MTRTAKISQNQIALSLATQANPTTLALSSLTTQTAHWFHQTELSGLFSPEAVRAAAGMDAHERSGEVWMPAELAAVLSVTGTVDIGASAEGKKA